MASAMTEISVRLSDEDRRLLANLPDGFVALERRVDELEKEVAANRPPPVCSTYETELYRRVAELEGKISRLYDDNFEEGSPAIWKMLKLEKRLDALEKGDSRVRPNLSRPGEQDAHR